MLVIKPFTFTVASNETLYVSEVSTDTLNPDWMPITWSYNDSVYLNLPSIFVLSIYMTSIYNEVEYDFPTVYPTKEHPHFDPSREHQLLYKIDVDLRTLQYIGSDIKNALTVCALSSSLSQKKEKNVRDRVDVIDLSGYALPATNRSDLNELSKVNGHNLKLSELPLNCVFFRLTDGYYVENSFFQFLQPDTASRQSASSGNVLTKGGDVNDNASIGTSGSQSSTVVNTGPSTSGLGGSGDKQTVSTLSSSLVDRNLVRPPPGISSVSSLAPSMKTLQRLSGKEDSSELNKGPPKIAKHDIRKGMDTIYRLLQIKKKILEAKLSEAELLDKISGHISKTNEATSGHQYASMSNGETMAHLRQLRDNLKQQADAMVAKNEQKCEQLVRSSIQATRLARFTTEVESILPVLTLEIDNARDEALLLRTMVSAKQLSLLSELRSIYAISEPEKGKVYKIRGITLPLGDEIITSKVPEEQISTALGYACHSVALISKYLNVPLRYLPKPLSSRSTMQDEIMGGGEYPLYRQQSGTAKDNLRMIAIRMLAFDTEQLLASQGISCKPRNHLLANLNLLYTTLLDAPLGD